MSTLTKDARGFVDGVVGYLKRDGKTPEALPRVRTLLQKVTARAQKEQVALVQSAVGLTLAEKQRLEQVLARIVGRSVTLECTVHPQLLGGLTIRVGDWIVDTSLSGQLESLSRSLL